MHVDRSRFLLLTATLAATACNAKTDTKAEDKTEAKAGDKADEKAVEKADEKAADGATPSSPDTVAPPGDANAGAGAKPLPDRAAAPIDEGLPPSSVTEG